MSGYPIEVSMTQKKAREHRQGGPGNDTQNGGYIGSASNTNGLFKKRKDRWLPLSISKPNKNGKRVRPSIGDDPDGDYHDARTTSNTSWFPMDSKRKARKSGSSDRPYKKQKSSSSRAQNPDEDYVDDETARNTTRPRKTTKARHISWPNKRHRTLTASRPAASTQVASSQAAPIQAAPVQFGPFQTAPFQSAPPQATLVQAPPTSVAPIAPTQSAPAPAPTQQPAAQQVPSSQTNPDDDGLNNRTSLKEDQEDWTTDNFPEILYVFERTRAHLSREPKPTRTKRIHGQDLTDYPILPDNISSDVEEFRVEAWLRLDSRLQLSDITLRMHPNFRIGNNALQMRGNRFRKHFSMLAWGSGSSRTENNKRLLVSHLNVNGTRHSNSTRGLTPGLIDPTKGEDGGKIPVPESYRRKWEQHAIDRINSWMTPADEETADHPTGDEQTQPTESDNAQTGDVAIKQESADDNGQVPTQLLTGTVRPKDLRKQKRAPPIMNGDDWLDLGLESEDYEPEDEEASSAANNFRQADMGQEDIDALFNSDHHARDYAIGAGIDLDMVDVPAIDDPQGEEEAEIIEGILEDFITKQRQRDGPLRNFKNLPYVRSLLALHAY